MQSVVQAKLASIKNLARKLYILLLFHIKISPYFISFKPAFNVRQYDHVLYTHKTSIQINLLYQHAKQFRNIGLR